MSNLVFVSGDFSSGTTLLWLLFQRAREYYTLYEPLHEKLLEHLISGNRVYEHHYHVDDYYKEYKGFDAIPRLFKPEWGSAGLYLPATEAAPDLFRYFSYLIGMSFGRSPRVLLKENRLTFRLGWIRAHFPSAKILHIYRPQDDQWRSIVRRAQSHAGKEDVGQDQVTFSGMRMAQWCDDLTPHFPELAAENSRTGYERFCKLWQTCYAENLRYADLSINYWDLTHDFDTVCRAIQGCLGCDADLTRLRDLVVAPEQQQSLDIGPRTGKRRLERLFDKGRAKYARLRLRLRDWLHGTNSRA